MTVERIIESCTTPSASELVYDAGLEELKAFLKDATSADTAAETLFAALSTRLQLPDPQASFLLFSSTEQRRSPPRDPRFAFWRFVSLTTSSGGPKLFVSPVWHNFPFYWTVAWEMPNSA